ncbi:MAG: amidophosphoribosyltransferase [Bacteroidota bacterium]
MSDQIKHECGIALIRLLRPLEYYHKKYGTALYGLNKMYLLLQKMRNRGQDGAGIATIKLDQALGRRYISRYRSIQPMPIKDIFDRVYGRFNDLSPEKMNDPAWLKENMAFVGEVLLGHLRYGTHGSNKIDNCHPVMRQNNWINRNLILAGNFNLTNVDELFGHLVDLGQHPKEKSDTVTVLEKIGHFLDFEVEHLFEGFKYDDISKQEMSQKINENLNLQSILSRSAKKFDGGYVMGGMLGHGDSFAMRDPGGIRPAYFYHDDEIAVVASERPAIQTAMNVRYKDVEELAPGHALIIKKNGVISHVPFIKSEEKKACSFERIYFSRGTDRDIYLERKKLGEQLAKPILKAVNYDFDNTVFSFVPNTAEVAFYGLVKGLDKQLNKQKRKKLIALGNKITDEQIEQILSTRFRMEKLVVKDAKLRTFITEGASRDELVSHVYDVTYGIVKNDVDTLVLMDDSIVRGTTLRKSILNIVSRLFPKRIIVVSSAPQIRYPDCYGIDMSKMGNFVAFKALVSLLKETGQCHLMEEAYKKCEAQLSKPPHKIKNEVKWLYSHFSYEDISKKIAEIVTPKGIKPKVDVIYQTLDGLHKACPNNLGDWYFSGNYPTPGGNRVANRAFMNYMEGKDERAY